MEQCLQIVAVARDVTLPAGTVLLDPGAPPAVHVIVSGTARVAAEGKPERLAGTGDFVGLAETLSGRVSSCRATATDNVRALRLDADDLLSVLGEHPELLRRILKALVEARRGRPTG